MRPETVAAQFGVRVLRELNRGWFGPFATLFADVSGFTALVRELAPSERYGRLSAPFFETARLSAEHGLRKEEFAELLKLRDEAKQSAERLLCLLNPFYAAVVHHVEQCKGVVDKLIGDCVMADFGELFNGCDDGWLDAWFCACGLLTAALPWIREVGQLVGVDADIGVHIGGASGWGFLGAVGVVRGDMSAGYSELTALGDHVNLASRLAREAQRNEAVVQRQRSPIEPTILEMAKHDGLRVAEEVLQMPDFGAVEVWRIRASGEELGHHTA